MIRGLLNRCRNVLLFGIKYRWVKHGRDTHCQSSALFTSRRRDVILGDHVGIGHHCIFAAATEVGDKVLIGSVCAFLNSDDHRYDIVGKAMVDSGRGDQYEIIVEDDVWIGYGSILLSPLRIGRGSIVAAGSVVTRDVPRYAVVGGVPAKVLRMRFTPEQIAEHERTLIEKGELEASQRTVTE